MRYRNPFRESNLTKSRLIAFNRYFIRVILPCFSEHFLKSNHIRINFQDVHKYFALSSNFLLSSYFLVSIVNFYLGNNDIRKPNR